MIFTPGSFGTTQEANSCHLPAGTPAGGQFCSKGSHGQNTRTQARATGRKGRATVQAPARAGRPDANPVIQGHAAAYARTLGLRVKRYDYLDVDQGQAGDIADAYDALPAFSRDVATKKAYRALASEVQAQWDFVKAQGVKLLPWTKEGQPYQTSTEMADDVKRHRRLYFFTGGEPHPFMGKADAQGLTLNDKFRAIHDYFGHAAGGYGFGPRGEENAWAVHSQMFSRQARRAMTTETRGQNSWVNFGRHNYDAQGNYKNIPPKDRPYAKQKVALLPDRFVFGTGSLREANSCHEPAGSPAGGQFCSGEGKGMPTIEWSDDGGTGTVRLSDSRKYRFIFREEYKGLLKYEQRSEDAQVTRDEVDLAVEHRAIAQAFASSSDFWTSNDPDAKFIKKSDGDWNDALPDNGRRLGAMIVMTLSIGDYGMGSGGPGSAKVFWGPYSAPNRFDRLKTDNDKKSKWDSSYGASMGVDPVYVLVHELHHAWGSSSEFDSGSDTVALDAHLKLDLPEKGTRQAVRYALTSLTGAVTFGTNAARRNKAGRQLRYLLKRNPEALAKRLIDDDVLSQDGWNALRTRILSIGRRKPDSTTEGAHEPTPTGVSPVVGPTRCLNVRKIKSGRFSAASKGVTAPIST